MSYLTSKAMQTTAIGTVANSLPENKVILITLLNSSRYIPYTDLRKITTTANFGGFKKNRGTSFFDII